MTTSERIERALRHASRKRTQKKETFDNIIPVEKSGKVKSSKE